MPVVITVLNTIVTIVRIPKKPSIVFIGQGTKPGMPKLAPLAALKTGSPTNNASKARKPKEAVGRLEYKERKNDVFSTLSADARLRSHNPKTIPQTKASPMLNTCVAIPAEKATHSTKYIAISIAK